MKKALLILLITFALFLFKLDYSYFFTDEILYVNAGREYLLKNDYSLNLQHPLVAKYIAGIASLPDENNVFLMRIPFALISALSAVVVYFILKDNVDERAGLIGVTLYAVSPYIFSASRMVMMEGPMHLFWLLFGLFFLRFIKNYNSKESAIAGIFMGLSLATKFNSAVLIPVSLILIVSHSVLTKRKFPFVALCLMFLTASLAFGTTYIPLLLTEGTNGIIHVVRAIKDVLLERNSEGKLHVIGDKLYQTSPWWFYLYYVNRLYTIFAMALAVGSLIYSFMKRSWFTFFWLGLFILNVIAFQSLTLKNARYISSMEISLVILGALLISDLYKNYAKYTKVFLILLVATRFIQVLELKPESYNALYLTLKAKTANFTINDRIYIYGSIRSSRWYFDGLPEDLIVSRKDFDVMAAEFPNFKYIAIDPIEEIKNPQNELTAFLQLNQDKYDKRDLNGINLYTRK